MQRFSVLLILFLVNSLCYGSELEFAISDDTVETRYQEFYAGSFSTSLSWLHADSQGVKSDNAGLGIFAHGKAGKVRTHLGGKAFWLHSKQGDNKSDMHGIALGGSIDAFIISKLFASGKILYAPDIITGGDAENYTELGARISFMLLPNATIFAGYRFLETELNDEDFEVVKGGFVGFNFNI